MNNQHEGVSCDGCMDASFSGDRFKCLRCPDFDLCSKCYIDGYEDNNSLENESTRSDTDFSHHPSHPMQCIMTRSHFEQVYEGDPSISWERTRAVVFTCPVCALNGLRREAFVSHVLSEHMLEVSCNARLPEMACPICITTDIYRVGDYVPSRDYVPPRLTNIIAHMHEHEAQNQLIAGSVFALNSDQNLARNISLSEFLNDRELRLALLRDQEFFDSTLWNELRSSCMIQRADALQRIRQRFMIDERGLSTQSSASQSDDIESTSRSSIGTRRNIPNIDEIRSMECVRGISSQPNRTSSSFSLQGYPGIQYPPVHVLSRPSDSSVRARMSSHRGTPPSSSSNLARSCTLRAQSSRTGEASRSPCQPHSNQILLSPCIDVRQILMQEYEEASFDDVGRALAIEIASSSLHFSALRPSNQKRVRLPPYSRKINAIAVADVGGNSSASSCDSKVVNRSNDALPSHRMKIPPLFYANASVELPVVDFDVNCDFQVENTGKAENVDEMLDSLEKKKEEQKIDDESDAYNWLSIRIGRSIRGQRSASVDECPNNLSETWRYDNLLDSELLLFNAQLSQDTSANADAVASEESLAAHSSRSAVRKSRLSETRMRKTNKTRIKEAEPNIENATEFVQSNFKEANVSTMIGRNVTLCNRSDESIRVDMPESQRKAFSDWLKVEEQLDQTSSIFDFAQQERTMNELLKSIPEFCNLDLENIMSETAHYDNEAEQESFSEADGDDGNDDDVLKEKFGNSRSSVSTIRYHSLGLFGPEFRVIDDNEKTYWSDYRFLHTRRNDSYIDDNEDGDDDDDEKELIVDEGFCKRLLLGLEDNPLSCHPYSAYLPDSYERVLRTVLRKLHKVDFSDEGLDVDVGSSDDPKNCNAVKAELAEVDSCERFKEHPQGSEREEDISSMQSSSDYSNVFSDEFCNLVWHVPPSLWHFLDARVFLPKVNNK